ncbi:MULTISPECIES: IS30 family transposase [Clostridium]|nr:MULTISPECIES: IS30 family transposase [Clostridium]MBY6811966.1 IS30 family transposase [Clostridium botulinum]MBY6825416.1 IS30 family transposase [Clostridium botulinum]MBY6835769.1 IS30 family transposase [Clostridium botulinum]MBY6974457.1 IS30 family transposase [Clostridium botulinum]HBJ1652550.1 IS30 family transposase [Clostridium botulinum]
MDHQNNNTESRKNKHLNFKDRMTIELRCNDGFSPYKIAKELNRPINTILNEIRRGTTTQIKQGNYVEVYLADTGEAVYKNNRQNSCRTFKRLECSDFINYAVDKIKNHSWSPDACVGNALAIGKFERSQIICTKTLYNYIDLGLLAVINADLPMKLRRNTKPAKVKKHKKKLGKSIAERPNDINNREEFGHWEIDTVVGEKSNNDCVLLTILERNTRNAIIHKIVSKTAAAVTEVLNNIRNIYGKQFSKVFKTITSDNGSEFADLSALEADTDTKVYFTHPYSSFEKGTNERHNGLIRRFIPKGKRMSDYSLDDIAFIEDWMNTLPRRILNYKTPEELFELHLDEIYSI